MSYYGVISLNTNTSFKFVKVERSWFYLEENITFENSPILLLHYTVYCAHSKENHQRFHVEKIMCRQCFQLFLPDFYIYWIVYFYSTIYREIGIPFVPITLYCLINVKNISTITYCFVVSAVNGTALIPEKSNATTTVTTSPIATTTRRPLLQGLRLPCSCQDGQCGCCTGYILDRFNQKACLNITYEPDDFALTAAMSMNGKVLYKNSISGNNRFHPFRLGPRGWRILN